MVENTIKITEIISTHTSDTDTSFLKCKSDENKVFVFWGTPTGDMENIETLKQQKLPFILNIENIEKYIAPKYMRIKYNANYSISEETLISIVQATKLKNI